MMDLKNVCILTLTAVMTAILNGCGAPPVTNANLSNTNSSLSRNIDTNTNSSSNSASSSGVSVDAREPEHYQALVTVKVEAMGGQQNLSLPTLGATVARDADNRRMEFTMPAGGRVVFLDKGGTNYLLLPEKKQYAELNKESLGFDVRRLMMPEQIVAQAKGVQGMQFVGDESYNGRPATKYKYAAVANTGTQAGQVETDSFLLVDKQTGLPLHSETTSQSKSGASVQGYNAVRVVTEISDIKTDPSPDLFEVTSDLKKIESDQVRQQVDMIFSAFASFLTQMMNNAPRGLNTNTANSNSASPTR
jgi:hypothetical protein